MPTKQFSIRISETAYHFIALEAEREGVSVAQFVRESAYARVWWQIGLRGEDPGDISEALRAGRERTYLTRRGSREP